MMPKPVPQLVTEPLPEGRLEPQFRIGAVSRVSGVPVSTLRVWESRYAAFTPGKSAGRHRLYSQSDTFKAGLLKQLTQCGHGISNLAKLDNPALQRLLLQTRGAMLSNPEQAPQARQQVMMLIGVGMANRMASEKFTLKFADYRIGVSSVFVNLDEACAAAPGEKPDILLVKLNTLQDSARQQIESLITAHGIGQAIVIYSYGREAVAEALRLTGLTVRREPVSDYELSDLIRSVLGVDAAHTGSVTHSGSPIPARQYSDETLARMAAISSNVLCECPRHVAELIGQLASFEQYSQECLIRHADDAHLHGYLRSISGAARAMFERALERVAEYEGIALSKIEA